MPYGVAGPGTNSAGPYSGGGTQKAASGARTVDPDRSRKTLADSIARLKASGDPSYKKMLAKYGPDIDPKILADRGLKAPKKSESNVDKIKRTGAGALLKGLDYISRPGKAVLADIQGLKEGKSSSERFSAMGKALTKGDGPSSLGGALGKTAAEEPSGAKGVLYDIANFTGTAVADPTSYISLGTGTAAKSALKNVAETAGKDVATQVAKDGVKSIGKRELESIIRKGVEKNAGTKASTKSVDKLVEKQVKALSKGAQGGIKLGGKTVIAGKRFTPLADAVKESRPVRALVDSRPFNEAADRLVTLRDVKTRFGQGVSDSVKEALSRGRTFGERQTSEDINMLQKAVRNSRASEEEIRSALQVALDTGGDVSALPEHLRGLGRVVGQLQERLTDDQIRAGVLPAAHANREYLARSLTKEGRRVLQDNADQVAMTFGKNQRSELASTLRQSGHLESRMFKTTAKAETALQHELGDKLKPGKTFFEQSPVKATALRAADANRAIGVSKAADDLLKIKDDTGNAIIRELKVPGPVGGKVEYDAAKKVAKKERNALQTQLKAVRKQEGYALGQQSRPTSAIDGLKKAQKVADLGTKKTELEDALKAHKMPAKPTRLPALNKQGEHLVQIGERSFYAKPEIANAITNALSEPERGYFSALANRLQTVWKGYATVLTPAFHNRNALGNVWNNFLAGVKDPAAYLRATKIQIGKGLTEADKEAVQQMLDHGVIDSGFFPSDTNSEASELMRGLTGKSGLGERTLSSAKRQLGVNGRAINTGRKVGTAVENNARAAHYLWAIDQGMSPESAALSVKKYLFDYSDLTEFEKRKLKAVIPFYTYMRKNTPLQLEALVKNPGKFAHAATGREIVAGESQTPGGEIPSYLSAEGQVPVSGVLKSILSPGSKGNVFAGPDLPFNAAAKTLNPLVKTIAAVIPGDQGTIEPDGFKDIAKDLVNLPAGGLVEGAKILIERATGVDLYTGGSVKGSAWQDSVTAAMPIFDRLKKLKDKPTAAAFANLVLGFNSGEVTTARQQGEAYDRMLKAQALLKKKGTPTKQDLQKLGLIPKTPTKRQGSSGRGGPYGG